MTREKDEDVPLVERPKMAQKLGADAFISVHANSSGSSPKPEGIETYYANNTKICFENSSRVWNIGKSDDDFAAGAIVDVLNYKKSYFSYKLSKSIQSEMISFANDKNHLNIVDRGVKTQNFVVLVEGSVPATLVEVGFITNPREARLLSNKNYRNLIAYSIAQGVERYFVENWQDKETKE